ncbi:MAG TPA: gliding motility-associated C-terminal domain-containing protein [Bacteroidia bacterium]|jgi:gliding motility-associated-like protein|nr:gliding motility-associated C-terminal domain-containing protein [Bacteroidia bacterium]
MNKSVLSFFVGVLSFVAFGQNETGAKKNLSPGSSQMVSKEHNYTSFAAPAKKEVSEELAKKTPGNLKNHPEYGILPYNVQCEDCYEVLEDRTATTRRYLKNGTNGSVFYNQSGFNEINYKDAAGNWRAIDPRIFPLENTSNIFVAANQPSPTKIDLNKKEVSVFNGGYELSFNRNLKLYYQSDEGKKLIASANWSNTTVGTDGAYVKNIFPGIDLEVYAINGALKTNYIMTVKPAYTAGNLLIEDEMKLPAGTSFSTRRATKSDLGYEGMITVNNTGSDASLYEIGEVVGYDQSNHRKNPAKKFSYQLNGNNLSIVVPANWFTTQGLIFPLTIDPLVSSSNTYLQGSITGSGGNGSGTWSAANACPYTLVVASPANATITDVKWSFTYVAQNGAIKNDGAIDILYGACRSPGNATLYWTCQDGLPGNCIGTNVSIYSDYVSCIPAPQCASYNMNFTMRFYDAFGAACSNTFIGAAANWVMTVEGHTVEFSNLGSPFSVTTNTICFGQTVTATTTTQYGVPVRNVNWSFNSSGVPSVGSGNSAVINFPSAGTYTLYCIVTDACGQTTSSNQVITVNPIPTVTATPATNPLCQGQSTVLTASGATTYTWSANAGGGTGTTANVTPPVGTTVYTVTGTSSGCSNSGTVSVTVNPTPVITTTASPTSICAGQTATLTASGATSYTWNSGVTASTETVAPVSNTTYTVTGSSSGCTSTQTVAVAVTTPPTLTVTSTPPSICAGQTATVSVSGATTYTWSANAGSSTNPSVNVTPAITTTYNVTGNTSGCISTGSVVVTVIPLPTLTVNATPASICAGGTTTLTASGATTYTWSANSGGGNANPISVSPGSTTSYTLSGTQSGCSNSTVITVNVGTQPTVSAVSSATTICSSQSATLTASGATNYTWSPGGTTNPITVSPNTTTTYTLIGDNGGCSATTTITLNVNPTPTVTGVASPTTICSGQTSTLTVSGATTYTWSANAGGAVAATTTVSPNNTTTYTVTGASLGCSSTQTVTVTVTPTPTVTAVSSPTTICTGQNSILTAGGATTYTWSANAGGGSGTTATVSPIANTTYTVTGANGTCTGTATVSVAITPTPTITVNANPSALCAGQSSTLTVSGATTYTWSANAGGASTPTVAVTPAITTVYNVTGDNSGCTTVKSVTVTVNPIPTLAAVTSQTVCSGSNVSSINFNAGGAAVGWTNTNTNIGVAASGTTNIAGYLAPVVATQQVGVITATPADPLTGCVGASQTFTIVINPKPVVTGPPLIDSARCGIPSGDIKNLTVSGGTPNYTYQWYTGSVIVPGSAGTTLNLNNMPVGTYSLVVTDANMCTATAGPYAIGGTPAVIASFTANPTSGTAPLNVTFTNNSVGATTYNWNLGNGSNPTVQNPNTIYQNGGNYTVILTASNGTCHGTDTLTIHVEQSISIIIPNVFSPNGDNINDEFSFITSGINSLNCDIYNRWGQKIKTLSSPTDKWDGKLDNGHAATEGTYFYVVVASSYDGKPHNSQGSLTLVK